MIALPTSAPPPPPLPSVVARCAVSSLVVTNLRPIVLLRCAAVCFRRFCFLPFCSLLFAQLAFARFTLLAEYPHDSTAFT